MPASCDYLQQYSEGTRCCCPVKNYIVYTSTPGTFSGFTGAVLESQNEKHLRTLGVFEQHEWRRSVVVQVIVCVISTRPAA